jgi:hypothetical protein
MTNDFIAWIISVAILAAVVVFVAITLVKRQEMYDACIADGRKDYECYALTSRPWR